MNYDPKSNERTYDSGFSWVYSSRDVEKQIDRFDLTSPTGKLAATIYERRDCWGYGRGCTWYVWDEDGVGGENSSESGLEQAMIAAESAVLRWGKHSDLFGLRVERAETVAALRRLCDYLGDNDWPDDLHLADVIEKHIW